MVIVKRILSTSGGFQNTITKEVYRRNERGEFTKNALLYQNILEYYLDDNYKSPFRFTELARWLMCKNVEFRDYYSYAPYSHTTISSRIAKRRRTIQGAIDNLGEDGLIFEARKVKAEKNELLTPEYEYTADGKLMSLLLCYINIRADKNESEIGHLCNRIYNLIQTLLSYMNSYNAYFASRFFEKVKNCNLLQKTIDYAVNELLNPTTEYKKQSIFSYITNVVFEVTEFRKLKERTSLEHGIFESYIDALYELDDTTRKIVLYNKKLEIEHDTDRVRKSANRAKEWEEVRIQHLGNCEVIVSLGYCGECGANFPIVISFREYILGWKEEKLVCPKCNKHESVILYYGFVSHNLISLPSSSIASLQNRIRTTRTQKN